MHLLDLGNVLLGQFMEGHFVRVELFQCGGALLDMSWLEWQSLLVSVKRW